MSRRPALRSLRPAVAPTSYPLLALARTPDASFSLVKNLRNDKLTLRSLNQKHPGFVSFLTTFSIFAPISVQAREGSVQLINDASAIASISKVCAAAVGDIQNGVSKSLKAAIPDLAISEASWAAFEDLWDKCGVPSEHWSAFKESGQAAGMTWSMLAQVAAAQILEAPSRESRKPAMLNESLGEQIRKMAMGANPNIRVQSSTGSMRLPTANPNIRAQSSANSLPQAFVILLMALCFGIATTGNAVQIKEEASFDYLSSAASSAAGVVGTVSYVASKPASWIFLLYIVNLIGDLMDLHNDSDDD